LPLGEYLVHKPIFLLLDEATSALDLESEQQMYSLINDVQYVSVGHRPSLWQYHDRRLQLRTRTGDTEIGSVGAADTSDS
jgi:putative ATP-binding cassette transporter